MAAEKGLHDGHRNRVRERFLEEGLEKFRDHQALELLLFYAVPRKDTNELAHKLLNRFGNLSQVLDAPVDSLESSGLSHSAAVLLKLVPELCGRYYQEKYDSNDPVDVSDDSLGRIIIPYFISAQEERVLLMLLDSRGGRLYCDIISKGSISASDVNVRKILQLAVKYNARAAVIAHNHPSGIALPSGSDIKITKMIKQSLAAVGVVLMDHIIVAGKGYSSMAELDECCDIFM